MLCIFTKLLRIKPRVNERIAISSNPQSGVASRIRIQSANFDSENSFLENFENRSEKRGSGFVKFFPLAKSG
jgi:hypothetical protein